jgi:hypothetical protein
MFTLNTLKRAGLYKLLMKVNIIKSISNIDGLLFIFQCVIIYNVHKVPIVFKFL